jgi:chromosome partitioning protein
MRRNHDIPVHRCSPDHLPEAVAAAERAGIQLLLIDMPPDSRYALVAARCSDLVLIPMRPTLFDLKVTRALIQLLQSARASYAVVINAAPPLRQAGDSPMVRETRDALADIGPRLWSRQITHRLAVPYAVIGGAGVMETEPDGFAAREYGALWQAVCNKLKLERNHLFSGFLAPMTQLYSKLGRLLSQRSYVAPGMSALPGSRTWPSAGSTSEKCH